MKWELARNAPGRKRYVLCNADEGEPGTFKDRVLLTERADQVFEGMTIAGYAVGSDTGILYLRGEYAYLRPFLESVSRSGGGRGCSASDILREQGLRSSTSGSSSAPAPTSAARRPR